MYTSISAYCFVAVAIMEYWTLTMAAMQSILAYGQN